MSLSGNEYSLEQLDGNVLLIHFWATWCSSCAGEMKALNQFQKSVRKDKIIVIPVSEDFKGPDVVKKFYNDFNLSYLLAFLDKDSRWLKELKVPNLPTTFIVDAQGMHVATISGGMDWLNEESIKFVKQYLSDKQNYNPDYVSLLKDNKIVKDGSTKNQRPITQIETILAPSTKVEEGGIVMTNELQVDLKARRPVNSASNAANYFKE